MANLDAHTRKECLICTIFHLIESYTDSGFGYLKYCHRHLGFYRKEILDTNESGFIFRDKQYNWADVTKIKRYDSLLWSYLFYQAGTPLSYIFLNDGSRIKLRGRVIEREGSLEGVDSLSGCSGAYEELMNLFTRNTQLE